MERIAGEYKNAVDRHEKKKTKEAMEINEASAGTPPSPASKTAASEFVPEVQPWAPKHIPSNLDEEMDNETMDNITDDTDR